MKYNLNYSSACLLLYIMNSIHWFHDYALLLSFTVFTLLRRCNLPVCLNQFASLCVWMHQLYCINFGFTLIAFVRDVSTWTDGTSVFDSKVFFYVADDDNNDNQLWPRTVVKRLWPLCWYLWTMSCHKDLLSGKSWRSSRHRPVWGDVYFVELVQWLE